ncbi:hypothetical protein Acsp06_00700 [Actinomycetospora sp. NBRC 106375]|nr:hypothetical protein Acsp06_00700 [Actinomycetospora sp. NBRC 106375]
MSWGSAHWRVSSRGFVWERPLRRADEAALAETGVPLPDGDVLGVRVADEGVKQALLADDPDVYFTTPHFDGYPAVLVRLERIGADELRELVEEAWVLRAPKTVANAWLAEQGRS